MSKRFSLYLPDQLVEWIDNKAKNENRSRNNFVEEVLSDLRDGRLVLQRLSPLKSGKRGCHHQQGHELDRCMVPRPEDRSILRKIWGISVSEAPQ